MKGDLGISLIYRQPVINIILEKFQASVFLMAAAWVLSGAIGYILGIAMGLYKGSILDKVIPQVFG